LNEPKAWINILKKKEIGKKVGKQKQKCLEPEKIDFLFCERPKILERIFRKKKVQPKKFGVSKKIWPQKKIEKKSFREKFLAPPPPRRFSKNPG
jgi:hypothetical protein